MESLHRRDLFCAYNSDMCRGFSISNILLHMEINSKMFLLKFA